MRRPVVFADTNIVLDWLARREPHFPYAEAVFILAEQRKIELLISSFSILTTEYVLRKQLSAADTRNALTVILAICKVCAVGQREVSLALASGFWDFEDAVQYQTAMSHSASVFLTRNLKDFTSASIPVMTAETYVKMNA